MFVMNNYFGLGLDADICLDFHMAREENPNKFNSRIQAKGYYLKTGIRENDEERWFERFYPRYRVGSRWQTCRFTATGRYYYHEYS